MTVKIHVEGGGDRNKTLSARCRKGFADFFEKAGLSGRLPRVVACGARSRAYARFRAAHEKGEADEISVLLVDSEELPPGRDVWRHVGRREHDNWSRPPGATDDQLYLMVHAMEAWFYADKAALQTFYGPNFRMGALSQQANVEGIAKADLLNGLKRATRDCPKGEYSFQLLSEIDAGKLSSVSSPHAAKLLRYLERISTS